MESQIARYQTQELGLEDIKSRADIFMKCRWFKDIQQAEQAIVKIMYGQEIGLSPIQAMQQIYVIPSEGGPKLMLSGNIIASKIRTSGRYDYRILKSTKDECTIEFLQVPDKVLGTYSHTFEQAAIAGLTGKKNWKSNPKDMCFNRAISGGYKQFCPDIFSIAIYTDADDFGEGEASDSTSSSSSQAMLSAVRQAMNSSKKNDGIALNGDINQVVQEAQVISIRPLTPEVIAEATSDIKSNDETESYVDRAIESAILPNTQQPNTRPYAPEQLRQRFAEMVESNRHKFNNTPTGERVSDLNVVLSRLTSGDHEARRTLLQFFTGKESIMQLKMSEAMSLFKWLDYSVEPGTAWTDWQPSELCRQEFAGVIHYCDSVEPPAGEESLFSNNNLSEVR